MSLARGAVTLVCLAFAAALVWVFVEASTNGWTGVHVFDDDVIFRRGSISILAGSPAEEAKIPQMYSISSFDATTGKISRATIPLTVVETKALRLDDVPPPGMSPTARPILPDWTYSDEPDAELYHEIDPEEVRTGDALWIYFSNNRSGLLHVRSPLRSQTGILLFVLASGVALFNLLVPLLAWEKKPRAEETILFLAIGLLVCTTVLTLPLTLLQFFRGVESATGSLIAVPAIAFIAAVAALLHLAYVFPHPRLAGERGSYRLVARRASFINRRPS